MGGTLRLCEVRARTRGLSPFGLVLLSFLPPSAGVLRFLVEAFLVFTLLERVCVCVSMYVRVWMVGSGAQGRACCARGRLVDPKRFSGAPLLGVCSDDTAEACVCVVVCVSLWICAYVSVMVVVVGSGA